ncbi:MAG: 50S ribosomal protein L24e [Candidatus Thermoplasmatota archaeon]
MVERRTCTFCGEEIEPGTGKMYIKKDGTIYHFCGSKCQKNMLKLKRIPRTTRWTKNYNKKNNK